MPADATVLAIDTATEFCSVALLMGTQNLSRVEAVGQDHSQRILPMVDELLASAGLTLGQVDVIAFGAGPGSFTGLRIACGIAQGLAWGAGKKVIGIGNLRALAAQAFGKEPNGARALAAVDARMNEAYCGVYRRDGAITEVRAPALVARDAIARFARDEGVDLVAGNALLAFAEARDDDGARWRALPDLRASATDIAALARQDWALGLAIEPALAAPIYVRDRVAMTVEERAAARAR